MKDCKLESSKSYAKYLMKKYLINTAEYKTADNKNDLKKILEDIGLPCYIKADGLAAGNNLVSQPTADSSSPSGCSPFQNATQKNPLTPTAYREFFLGQLSAIKAETEEEYFKISNKYLDGYFGKSSQKIIVEKYIKGIEVSIPLILDGKNIKIFNIVRDYKRRNNQDKGSNTGGMGAYCPYILTKKQMQLVENLIKKLEFMLPKENHLYKGFMTINVILTDNDIYLLEINTRLGDSEGQTVLKMLNDDLFEIFNLILKGQIENYIPDFKIGFSMSLNIINKTYPEIRIPKKAYITKSSVQRIINNGIDVFFYNRIKQNNKTYIQMNDRFLSLCAYHQNLDSLSRLLNNAASSLSSRNVYCRTDLGVNR